MKDRIKRVLYTMNLSMDGKGRTSINLYLILYLILSIVSMKVIKYTLNNIYDFSLFSKIYEENFNVLVEALDIISLISISVSFVVFWVLPKQKYEYQITKMSTFLPINKEELVISRFLSFGYAFLLLLIPYIGMFNVKIENSLIIEVRGVIAVFIIMALLFFTVKNITRFLKRGIGEKLVNILGLILMLAPSFIPLIIFEITGDESIFYIFNSSFNNRFIKSLGGSESGLWLGLAIISLIFIFNYLYVKRQVYKKG
ncbi:hypothetical protein [Clostridium sp.]|uniref:hypothetical protein n=1 Tax=Clostridium sp. TaxID=1506 RepID=UPI001D540829|nr:hypothetical protein [Clostridium sp.]MBS5986149.1 hypothetical protein [Clostridium sp.]